VADAPQLELGEQLYGAFQVVGIDVLLDDRSERAGVKFKDADLLGIPWRVVVGRGAADGQVELVQRASGERSDVPAAEVVSQLQAHLERERAGLLSA
jgi:prolyl-tRNA synthetase